MKSVLSKFSVLPLVAASVALLGVAPVAQAQLVSKPIRLMVGQPAGGGTDAIARIIAQKMSEEIGQSIVVENRPGAGGTIANQLTATATPDGSTIMLGEISCLSISPTLYPKSTQPSAFEPIGLVASNTFALVTSPGTKIKSIAELISRAKEKPDTVTYDTPGNGTLQHLAAELFKTSTGVTMQHVPYKGGGPATLSVMSGETDAAFIGIPPLIPQIAAGKLVPLGVGSAKRTAQLPDVPTFAESGVKGFEAIIWYGFVAPKGTPKDVIKRLHDAANKAVADPEVQKGLAKVGVEPMQSSPEEYAALIKSESEKWAKVIKSANIKVD